LTTILYLTVKHSSGDAARADVVGIIATAITVRTAITYKNGLKYNKERWITKYQYSKRMKV